MKTTLSFPLIVVWCLCLCSLRAADPVVSKVRAAQRPGTQLVDITYDVADPDSATLTVSVAVSDTGGATYAVPASSFSGDAGSAVTPGGNKRIVWDAGRDWPGMFSANMRFRVTAQDAAPAPTGMVLIPAGSFQMGDSFGEGDSDERPVHTVTVSAFYMDKYEVTKALWDEVYAVGDSRPLSCATASTTPVRARRRTTRFTRVNWYDVVKWCNARSEKEGRVPAYYTSAAQTDGVPHRAGRRAERLGEVECGVSVADGGGVGVCGAGGLEREAVSVGGHDQPQPGELLQLEVLVQLRRQPDARVSSDV